MSEAAISKPFVLIIDDEISIGQALAGFFSDEGWLSEYAISGHEGIQAFKKRTPDLVLLDVWMPGMDGIETLQRLKQLRDDIPVVIMSGHGTIDTAVKCTKLGAFDFLEKPLSIEKLLPMMDHAVQLRKRRATGQISEVPGDSVAVFQGSGAVSVKRGVESFFRGVSHNAENVRRTVSTIATRNGWILIVGENGVGKEVVGRAIHAASARSSKSFVVINCNGAPESMMESELFGHVEGAVPGAFSNKTGKFELADGGTLFLDEVAGLSLRTQAGILRVLQDGKLQRIGDEKSRVVDVRVIAATTKDLQAEIRAGRFREDLYQRLNVIPVYVPPLRERREDIPYLADLFLEQLAFELKEPRKLLSDEVFEMFLRYPWPGNVRELKNLLERLCVVVFGDEIDVVDLPESIVRHVQSESPGAQQDKHVSPDDKNLDAGTSSQASLRHAKMEFERNFVLDRLTENQWNITKTAEVIGIERSHLHKKLKGWGVDMKKVKEES